RGPIDELEPARQAMLQIADRARTIGLRLEDTVSYRLTYSRAFALPTLPISTSTEGAQALSVNLVTMIADTMKAAVDLPDDPILLAHLAQLDDALAWFQGWEVDYIDALRREDVEAATELVGEAKRRVRQLERSLEGPLAEMNRWAEEAIAQLQAALEQALVLTGP
ncbi:MAG: hypothetical protein ACE5KX_06420, partial [Acidimicrobiia bacterium]